MCPVDLPTSRPIRFLRSDSLSQKLTVNDKLNNAYIGALPENNRPFQIAGTSALGRFTLIVSLSGISLFNNDTNKVHGQILWT